jgi:hypothetical protein
VLRSYDLKGSCHNREVLKKNETPDASFKKTMKDIDFGKLEEKIWVSNEDASRLKRIIREDSKFLCGLQLIDYSLIVLKINMAAMEQTKGDK